MTINAWINMAKYNFRVVINHSDRDIFTDSYAILYTAVCNMREPAKTSNELYTLIKSITKNNKISLISPIDFKSMYYTFKSQSDVYNLSVVEDLINLHIVSSAADLIIKCTPPNSKDLALELREIIKPYNHKLPNYSQTVQKINSIVNNDFVYFSVAYTAIRSYTLGFIYYYTLLISSSVIDSLLVIYYSPTNNKCKLHKKFRATACERFKVLYPNIYKTLSTDHCLKNTIIEFNDNEYEMLMSMISKW
jgi:hypothetical protein